MTYEPIIPAHTLILHFLWKCFSWIMRGFVDDHYCALSRLIRKSRVKVDSCVHKMYDVNWLPLSYCWSSQSQKLNRAKRSGSSSAWTPSIEYGCILLSRNMRPTVMVLVLWRALSFRILILGLSATVLRTSVSKFRDLLRHQTYGNCEKNHTQLIFGLPCVSLSCPESDDLEIVAYNIQLLLLHFHDKLLKLLSCRRIRECYK